ncbi:heme ABC transporter ATP-binding protein [Nitrincola sp. MINF-07-Sa-05]|uniref:heme ABC transporter ATP-binding protein n=1 Tax=Nitrincola salilacus TaxID=3400273 RepID=UPI003917CC4E
MIAVEINDLSVSVDGRHLLSNISFKASCGEVIAILGPNGAGKSTLLKAISGDLNHHSLPISLFGQPRECWDKMKLASLVGVLPQQTAVLFPFRAREIVMLGRIPHKCSTEENELEVELAMRKLDVWHLRDRLFPQLSGGEKQRVHFARVLAQLGEGNTERLLLLDEPTSALDLGHQHQVLALSRKLAHESAYAVILVLHDLNLAARYADRILLLQDGRLIADGTPDKVLGVEPIRALYHYEARRLNIADLDHPVII